MDHEKQAINFLKIDKNSKAKKDLVIIGDSIVKHINMDLVNPGKDNQLFCFKGGNVKTIRKEIIDIDAKLSIKSLVLHVGSNFIPADSPDLVAAQILDLVKEIQIQMPSTKIYISAILPKINADYNPGINFINSTLYNESLKKGFVFIQHNKFSRNGVIDFRLYVKREVEAERPIHLSYGGVARLACDIKYAITNDS